MTQFDLFDAECAPARPKAPTGIHAPPERRKRAQAPPATENRRRRRVLMHVIDAGNNTPDGRDVARWWCTKCGHETGWVPAPTKQRPPCPKCNKESE